LKKQAESSKKRKLEDDLTSIPKPAKRLPREDDEPLPLETDLGMGRDDSRVVEEKFEVEKPLRFSTKRALPAMLPAEYLEDEEPRDQLPFEQFPIKKAKKTKFNLIAEKEPKDRRVGSTTYRVTKANSTNLAPKSSSNARNTKEQWLQGRSGKNGATKRTPFSKGFFKK
jgi:U3 small nucleolar RNA-associated protein 16